MGNMKLLIICFIVIVNSYKVTARGPTSQYLPPNAGGVGHAGSVGGQTQYQTSSSHRSSTQYSQHGSGTAAISGGSLGRFSSNAGGAVIPILRNDFHNDGYGNYNFGFETGNGIRREENGIFENIGPEGSLNVHGSYSYTGDDGRVYSVNYKADSSGFHAEGDHLPTPPTVPQHSQQQQQQTLRLHQPGGSGSFSSFGGGGGGSANVRHHQSASSFNSPNANYLPPSASGSSSGQSSGYNYNRHH